MPEPRPVTPPGVSTVVYDAVTAALGQRTDRDPVRADRFALLVTSRVVWALESRWRECVTAELRRAWSNWTRPSAWSIRRWHAAKVVAWRLPRDVVMAAAGRLAAETERDGDPPAFGPLPLAEYVNRWEGRA